MRVVKNKQELDEAEKAIKTILSTPTAFHQEIELGPFRTATDVAIKVERKQKDAKSETIIDAKVNFGGGPRFALAGGLAFTELEKREFQRVVSLEDRFRNYLQDQAVNKEYARL